MQSLVRAAGGLAFEVFYRHRLLGGEIPRRGPAILVANHPNGLVDALAAMLATRRPVRFLGKAPLFRMPVLGWILRAMGTLPVYRRIDGADTAENQRTFQAVFEALAEGGLVCLFPEGISHSEPRLQELKTGAARMALGAEANAPERPGVVLVPIGLVYGRKSRFRSRMAIWVGDAIEVADLIELHSRDERAAVRALTERIAEGLRRVTLQLEDWHDLPLIEIAERIWPQTGTGREVRRRAFAEGLHRLRRTNPGAADELETRVSEFRDRLEFLRLAPEDLDVDYTAAGVARFVLRGIASLLVTFPLAALGGLFWWLPFRATGWTSGLRRVEPDIVATQKLLVGLVLFPLWWLAAALLAGRVAGTEWGLAAAGATPLLGAVTLRWGDRFRAARRDVAGFLRFGSAHRLKAKLRARRDELLDAIVVREAELRATPAERTEAGDPAR